MPILFTFMGYRFIFNYATKQAGGYVDIDFELENKLTGTPPIRFNTYLDEEIIELSNDLKQE